jgi:predicted phage tail protein
MDGDDRVAGFVRIRDVFGNQKTWERWTVYVEETRPKLTDYLPSDWYPYRVSSLTIVNGKGLKAEELQNYCLQPGDTVELVRVPAGVVAVPLLVGSVISAISWGVQFALNRPPKPKKEYRYDPQTEFNPSRGWRGFQTTVGSGRPIPLVFGEVRCAGQMLETFYLPTFDKDDFSNDSEVTVVPIVARPASGPLKLCTRVGYCAGPVEEIHSIEVDDNPIENMKGIVYEKRLGSNRERAPAGFTESKNITTGGGLPTTITQAGGAVVARTDSEVNTVEVKLVFTAGLYEIENTNNQRIPRAVEIKFEYKRASAAAYDNYGNITVEHATPAAHAVWVRFPDLPFDQYDIRITRVTSDTADPDVEDEFQWNLMQEVRSAVRCHPGIAEVAFRQIPLDQQGVPQNYTAVVKGVNTIRTYSHPGEYTTGWSNSNAWCLAWFLTDPEHGLGRYFTWDNIDLVDFCDFSNDCDEMIDDGRGGKQKRAVFNYEFNEIEDAQKMIAKFTEGTRAFVPMYLGGKWRIILDIDGPVRGGFNEGNIKPGSFSYNFLPTYARPTRVLCNFPNEERSYRRDTFLQEDPTLEVGEYPNDLVTTFAGVTSPGQVAWLSYREIERRRLRDKMVEFSAGIEAYRSRPGQLIDVASIAAGVGVASGKLLAVSATQDVLTVDDNLELDDTKTYEITVYHKLDGRSQSKILTGVTTDPTQTVTVGNTLWDVLPQAGDGYTVGEVTVSKERFRITEIREQANFERRIQAEIFVEIEDQIISNPAVDVVTVPSPRQTPDAVPDVTAIKTLPKDSSGDTQNEIVVSWGVPTGDPVDHYEIWYKRDVFSKWHCAGTVPSPGAAHALIQHVLPSDDYEVKARAVTQAGVKQSLDDAITFDITV